MAQLLLLAICVWIIATLLDRAQLRLAFTRLKSGYLVTVVLGLSPLAVLLRALRWRRLLPGGERLPVLPYVRAYLIGVAANSFLLGKFGDFVKARLICRMGIDYERSLAVVAIDRLVEGLALLLLFAVVLLNSTLPRWTYRVAWIAALASLSALAGLRLLFGHRDNVLRVTGRVFRFFPAFLGTFLFKVADRLLSGCEALADFRRVLVALAYATSVWAVEITTVIVFLAAFSVPAPWFTAAMVIIVALNFGTLIPISPGSAGVYQLLCMSVLSIWGVDRQLSFAFGVVMQTVLFLPLYLVGFIWAIVWLGHRNGKSPAPVAAGYPHFRS